MRCAQTICEQARKLGIEVRAGAHPGKVEYTRGMDLSGMTVHIGARVAAEAPDGEVLVSRTVRDLANRGGPELRAARERQLRGVPGRWDLYAVIGAGAPAVTSSVTPRTPPWPTESPSASHRAFRASSGAVEIGNAWQRRRAKAN